MAVGKTSLVGICIREAFMATGLPEEWVDKQVVVRLVRQPSKTEASSAVPTTEPMLENHATGKLQAVGDDYGVLLGHVEEEGERSIFTPGVRCVR